MIQIGFLIVTILIDEKSLIFFIDDEKNLMEKSGVLIVKIEKNFQKNIKYLCLMKTDL